MTFRSPARMMRQRKGLDLADLEYIDIGSPLPPQGSVPVVVKTLLLDPRGGATA